MTPEEFWRGFLDATNNAKIKRKRRLETFKEIGLIWIGFFANSILTGRDLVVSISFFIVGLLIAILATKKLQR